MAVHPNHESCPAAAKSPRFLVKVLEALKCLEIKRDCRDDRTAEYLGSTPQKISFYIEHHYVVDGDVLSQVTTALKYAEDVGFVRRCGPFYAVVKSPTMDLRRNWCRAGFYERKYRKMRCLSRENNPANNVNIERQDSGCSGTSNGRAECECDCVQEEVTRSDSSSSDSDLFEDCAARKSSRSKHKKLSRSKTRTRCKSKSRSRSKEERSTSRKRLGSRKKTRTRSSYECIC